MRNIVFISLVSLTFSGCISPFFNDTVTIKNNGKYKPKAKKVKKAKKVTKVKDYVTDVSNKSKNIKTKKYKSNRQWTVQKFEPIEETVFKD